MNRLLHFLIVIATITLPAQADDWPQWLGQNRDSVWRETGIVEEFSPQGPTLKWDVEIGSGYSGPAVADGRVYVMDYITAGDQAPDPNVRNDLQGKERTLCFSSSDGRLLWKQEYDCPYEISYPAGPRTTPTVDGDHVYTLGAEGDLRCVKAEGGSLVWSKNFKQDYGAQTPIWGFTGHPLVDGDLLYCTVGGEGSIAVAFDKTTGQERWRSLTATEPGYSAPTIIEAGGKRQLLIWHNEALASVDPQTGSEFWAIPLDPNYGMSIATPRMLGDYLFVGAIVNKSMLLRLGTNQPTAEVVWRGTKDRGLGPVNCTPFLESGYIYGIDGQGELRCVDLESGDHLWSTYAATTGDRRMNSSTAFLVKNEDRFFIFNEKGELIIARLTPEKYDEISRHKILEPTGESFGRNVVWSHPAFAEKSIFARNDGRLACFSLAQDP